MSSGPLDWPREGAQWPHHAASRFVTAAGLRWHVQVHAAAAPGAPVLWLLHGTGAASHSWRGLVPLLAGEATLVVPDLPGHGFSAPMPRSTLPGMAAALAALATALALPPTVLVGHSAGAALAVRAVLDGHLAPQRLLGLNAALLPFEGLAGLLFAPMARVMARQPWLPPLFARRAGDASAVQRLVAATGSQLDAEGLALYARLLRSPGHVAGALAMMADWDLPGLWRDLPRLALPLGLVVGRNDGTVPPTQAQRTRLHLGDDSARVRVLALDGLGHLAHEESPPRVAQALRQLGALAPRPAAQRLTA